MKKIISLVLCAVLALGSMAAFAADAGDVTVSEGMRLSYDGIYYDEFLDSEATITVGLANGGTSSVPVTFIVAEYTVADGCKTMVGMKRVAESIDASSKKQFELKYDVIDSDNSISVFAYCTTSLGVVPLGTFELDAFQYVGSEETGASVYKINKFEE